jgi:hypothetical protein
MINGIRTHIVAKFGAEVEALLVRLCFVYYGILLCHGLPTDSGAAWHS